MPPNGPHHADVLNAAHHIRVKAGDYAIADQHLADAITELTQKRTSSMQKPVELEKVPA